MWFLPVFKLEVNWAEGNGDAEILFRLGANIERCDRAVLEICGLLCVCVFFFLKACSKPHCFTLSLSQGHSKAETAKHSI